MKIESLFVAGVIWYSLTAVAVHGEELMLIRSAVTLRSESIEWDEFATATALSHWESEFEWHGTGPAYIEWTQYDVKQLWEMTINDKPLTSLNQDENRMSLAVPIAAGQLIDGINRIRIAPKSKNIADDIVIEKLSIRSGDMVGDFGEAAVQVNVLDKATGKGTPARITLMHEDGALASHGLKSQPGIAARIGTIYTLEGSVNMPVRGGTYVVTAGRGFEYSLARAEIVATAGESTLITLEIERVVDTSGYAACDTHIHTLTHSGHGDCSIEERMITIAGEGIELAIAADHNKYVNYEEAAVSSGARRHFTPVIGCEVTTPRGHFNVFPISEKAPLINSRKTDWRELFKEIYATPDVGVAILNHARDLHSGVRPFASENHYSVQGRNALGWELGFNAMEVLNSAATQTDPLQLTQDWMALLNHGLSVAPIGCSDSHDVARHFVGQARTYVSCDDAAPDKLDVQQCVKAITLGNVCVSYGIFTKLRVNDSQESHGVFNVPADKPVEVTVDVQTPHWIHADQVRLYLNGDLHSERVLQEPIEKGKRKRWLEKFSIPPSQRDAHVVAVATGPGVDENYWRCAKPYQPISPHWESGVYGCSGAIWLNRDGNETKDSARVYALKIVEEARGDNEEVVTRLKDYDRAVAVQVFSILNSRALDLSSEDLVNAVSNASDAVKDAYRSVLLELRNHALAEKPLQKG